MNADYMLDEVRSNIDETTAEHWTDAEIMRKINAAQRKYAMRLSLQPGNWLITSSAVTPSDGVITLPTDCAKPLYIEETSSGTPIYFKTTVQDRRSSRSFGATLDWDISSKEAYLQMDAVVVNEDSYATACTLWYQIRVPDLLVGTGAAGSGSNVIIVPTTSYPERVNDYYNNSYLEVTAGTGVGTRAAISDYVASTRAITVAGTFGTDSEFGTISRLPEEVHPLIVLDATCTALAKSSAKIDDKVYQEFKEEKADYWRTFLDWASSRVPGAGRHTRITNPYE